MAVQTPEQEAAQQEMNEAMDVLGLGANIYNPGGNAATVNQVYNEVLGRDADPSGLANYAGQSASSIKKALMGSGEYQKEKFGVITPAVANPKFEKHLPFDSFMKEWNSVFDEPPTQYEYENWAKHGKPGQLVTEKGGSAFKVLSADGSMGIQVYTDLSALNGKPFNFLHEGEYAFIPAGAPKEKGYKTIKSADGFDLVYKKPHHGGLLGKAADVTGINEFKTLRDKWIPKEVFASDFGTGRLLAGSQAVEGEASIAKDLGLKPEEVGMASEMTIRIAGLVGSYFSAGATSVGAEALIQANRVSAGQTDLSEAFKNVGIAIAGAGVGATTTGSLIRGGYSQATASIFGGGARGAATSALRGGDAEDIATATVTSAAISGTDSPYGRAVIAGASSYAGTENTDAAIGAAAMAWLGGTIKNRSDGVKVRVGDPSYSTGRRNIFDFGQYLTEEPKEENVTSTDES